MKRRHRRTQVKQKAFLLLGIGVVLLLVISGMKNISAKYKAQATEDNSVQTVPFYFSSNCLSEEGEKITLSPETTEITIELRNYVDDLRSSTEEIAYSYSVVDQKDSSEITKGKGTISGGSKATDKLKISGLVSGETYDVTVTSTSPFKSTLKGTFIVQKESTSVHYNVTDEEQSAFVLVEVYTDNYNGNITVTWPDGVIPDSTDANFSNVNTWKSNSYSTGSTEISVESYTSYTYRFFKEDVSKKYSKNEFTVN